MLTMLIAVAVNAVVLVMNAYVLAVLARRVASPRGKLRFGLLVMAATFAISVAGLFAQSRFIGAGSTHALAATLGLGVVQLLCVFVIIRIVFRLTTSRAFVPMIGLFIVSLAEVAVLMGVVRPFVYEAYIAPTASMSPTIEAGDRFAVGKFLKPRRFSVVAYHPPNAPTEIYVKRVLALPGERLRFERGGLFINDADVPPPAHLAGRIHAKVSTPGGGSYGRYADGETITLGPDEVFLIGDNVEISFDSRQAGPSKIGSFVGVAECRYWPLGRIGIIH